MNNQTVKIVSAAISDRGLSQKRPLNEDSFIADTERRIFAVADGVGGAQAGEVASQTAVEVLDEAFRHQDHTVDVEDLMELAIQRANASIHRMAQEHPKLQMMATTIVALHLDGRVATIGHVGDSRLYRVTPDGGLHRDTRDHSVVEEEVRAGRMTPAQAAHHPSRNVISRALGADEGVEVDMKTIEVQEGTTFLLCSDGITRHIPDEELLSLLDTDLDPDVTCTEMKRLCYERGAEDNLTAVIVRVGTRSAASVVDDARTLPHAASRLASTMDGEVALDDPSLHETVDALRPLTPSRSESAEDMKHAEGQLATQGSSVDTAQRVASTNPRQSSSVGTFAKTFLFLVLLLGVAAAAFFGGIYKQRRDSQANADQSTAAPGPTPVQTDSDFYNKRREVDEAPAKLVTQLASEEHDKPLESHDPRFLYLYGRALLLSGQYSEANAAFAKAAEMFKAMPTRDSLVIDTRLAAAVAGMKSSNKNERDKAMAAFEEVLDPATKSRSTVQGTGNARKPQIATTGTVSPPAESPR